MNFLKKMYPLLSIGLLTFTACSEDAMQNGNTSIARSLDTTCDLTYGTNLFISGIDTLSNQRIPLNVDGPVEVKNHGGIVTFDCVEEEGKYYLRPKMLQSMQGATVLDSVTISVPGNSNLDKNLLVSVRKKNTATRASNDLDYKKRKRFADIFSYAVFPTTAIGAQVTRSEVLNSQLLLSDSVVNNIKNFVQNQTIETSQGNSIQEANENWGLSVGLKNIPLGKSGAVSASLGYTQENSSKYDYQYYLQSRNTECAVGTAEYITKDFGKYIANDFNQVLNTDKYLEQYPNTKEGIFKILDHYGLYIPTFCILGARVSYTMSKKQDIETHSDSWAAELTVSVNRMSEQSADSILGMNKDKLAAYKYAQDNKFTGSASFNYKNETVAQQVDLDIKVSMQGGNFSTATGTDSFVAGADPESWIPLAYSGKGQDAQLYPIYNLVVDKTSDRYNLLKKYIDGDGYLEYLNHREEDFKEPEERTRWVLADLKLKVTDDENIVPFKAKCPDGVERVYYPIMLNRYTKKGGWHSSGQGKVLDTQVHAFGRCVRRKKHVWYYALALHSECPGIKSINFVEHKNNGEINSMIPESANTGTGWQCRTTDRQLVVTPIDKEDKTSTPITAFALYDEEGNVIGSTGGTEYCDDAQHSNNFKDFWINEDSKHYRTKPGGPTKCGIYYLHSIHQPLYLYYMYSTKPLLLNDLNNGYVIQHPADMERGAF